MRKRQEYTHDGERIENAMQRLKHEAPASLAGLAVCITGIVPGFVGRGAENAAEARGARTTKNVSRKTALLVIGQNAGREKLDRAEAYGTPAIYAREFLALI